MKNLQKKPSYQPSPQMISVVMGVLQNIQQTPVSEIKDTSKDIKNINSGKI